MTTREQLQRLETSLDREHEIRTALVENLVALKQAILQCDPRAIARGQERLGRRLEELEAHRLPRDAAIQAVARAVGVQDRGAAVKLSRIEPHLPHETRRKVASRREEIRILAEETTHLNRENQVLLKGGLEIMDQLMSSFLDSPPVPRTYGPGGDRVKSPRAPGFLDTQI